MSDPLEGWDEEQADAEGWFITVGAAVWAYGWSIFCTGNYFSEANANALAFVQSKAREGSAYHIEALARIQLL